MPRPGLIVVLIGSLAGVLVACGSSTAVPSGAPQVHVTATTSEVRLDPTTVPAGDVYLVLDVPDAGVDLVQAQAGGAASPGPLTADDLARLAKGDTQGLMMETLSVNCCGKVVKKTLAPGRYAVVPGGTEDGQSPPTVAILQVGP